MQLLILLVVLLGSILLCKGIALVIVLLFAAVKNIRFRKDTAQWDSWFSGLTEHKVSAWIGCWYLISVAITSVITCYILKAFRFQYAMMITGILLAVRIGINLYRYWANRNRILQKLRHTMTSC